MKRLILLSMLGVSACTPYGLTPSHAPVYTVGETTQADYAPWAGKGDASLQGQGFLTTNGGDVKTCAGQEVRAIPANAADVGLITAISEGDRLILADPKFPNLSHVNTRRTVCNAQGNFEFDNLPPQSWIIETRVVWEVPNDYGGVTTEGGPLVETVHLTAGTNKIILDQDNVYNDTVGLFQK